MKRLQKTRRNRKRYKAVQMAQYFYFTLPRNDEEAGYLTEHYEHPKITVAIVQGKDNDYGIGVAVCSPDDFNLMLKRKIKNVNFDAVKELRQRGEAISYGRALKALREKKCGDKITRFDVTSAVIQCNAIDGIPFKRNILYKSAYSPDTLEPYILSHSEDLGVESSETMIDHRNVKSFGPADLPHTPILPNISAFHGSVTSDIKNRPIDGQEPRLNEDYSRRSR